MKNRVLQFAFVTMTIPAFSSAANAGWLDNKIKRSCARASQTISSCLEVTQGALNGKARMLASDAKERGNIEKFDDCVLIVAAGMASWGAATGGPIGAAVGAAGGVASARLACGEIFPH